jgi:hypothetical protein
MIAGTEGNYSWPVRFERKRGYVRIVQFEEEGRRVKEIVLLSRAQANALREFLAARRAAP